MRNTWIEQIMKSLKDDEYTHEIVNRLKRGEPYQDIAGWLGRPLLGKPGPDGLSAATQNQVSQAIRDYHDNLVENHDPRYWTNATQDPQLIEHLVQLYLTWINPTHMLFDEEKFLNSFSNCTDLYCAPGMVSVMCAMACHLLHDGGVDDKQTTDGINQLYKRFLNETKAFLTHLELHKMTTIQTYAIMFLAEFGSGHGLVGTSHLRRAVDTLIQKQTAEQAAESEQVSAWGIVTLHTWAYHITANASQGLYCLGPGLHSPMPSHTHLFRQVVNHFQVI